MPTDAVVVASTDAYQRGLIRTGDALKESLRGAFERFMESGRTDRRDILTWSEGVQPALNAAATEAKALAGAYNAATGARPAVATVDPVMFAQLVPFEGPFLRLWRGLKHGLPFEESVQYATDVAGYLGSDAVQQVARRASGAAGAYRRIPNIDACKWCAVVSTQLYRSNESATFGHNGRCKCTVVPVADTSADTALDRLRQERYARLKSDGVIDEISDSRTRARIGATPGRATYYRDMALNELATETDPIRRQRLRRRARSLNDRIAKANAAAAEKAAGI